MTDNNWPTYHLSNHRDHIHAIGVIAVAYSSYEGSLFRLYAHHPQVQKMPWEMAQLYYTTLNEERRLKAIQTVFKRYEKDKERLEFVESLIKHFDWCSDIRNKLLHSELYPAAFGGEKDKLYLIKPTSKNDLASAYLWLSVQQLREIADQFDLGKRTCAHFLIKLRIRDIPADQLPNGYDLLADEEWPDPLVIPPRVELSPAPQWGRVRPS